MNLEYLDKNYNFNIEMIFNINFFICLHFSFDIFNFA